MNYLLVSRSAALFSLSLAALLAGIVNSPSATDMQPPVLTILSTNIVFVRTPMFEIYGTATDDIGLKSLKVMTGTVTSGYTTLTNITLVGRSNNWFTTVVLAEGLNYFLIQVTDASGKTSCNLAAPTTHASCGQVYTVFSTNAARNPFEAWQVANFTLAELMDSAVSGENADPDGDGVRNFVEYTAGMNPKVASQQGLPTANLENSYLTMTYTQAKSANDVTNALLVSTNLTSWNSGSNYSTLLSTQDFGATFQFKARLTQPITNAPVGFMRLDVQRATPTVFGDTFHLNSVASTLKLYCQACHSPGGLSGIPWYDGDVYGHLVGVGSRTEEQIPLVFPGFPEYSALYHRVASSIPSYRMPANAPPLSPGDIEIMRKWIQDGAPR